MIRQAIAILVVSMALLFPAIAASPLARRQPCQVIASIPHTINSPGNYCVNADLSTAATGPGILISASSVNLDCRQRRLTHTNPANGSPGIASGGQNDVVVQNCQIENFAQGIVFVDSSQHIRIENNDVRNAKLDGIRLGGSHSRITGNRVVGTNNTDPGIDFQVNIALAPAQPGVHSTGNTVQDNIIAGAGGNATIIGIRVESSDNATVTGNQVLDLAPTSPGAAYSLMLDESDNTTVDGNAFIDRVQDTTGIHGGAPAVCRNNLSIGLASSGFSACIAASGNRELP